MNKMKLIVNELNGTKELDIKHTLICGSNNIVNNTLEFLSAIGTSNSKDNEYILFDFIGDLRFLINPNKILGIKVKPVHNHEALNYLETIKEEIDLRLTLMKNIRACSIESFNSYVEPDKGMNNLTFILYGMSTYNEEIKNLLLTILRDSHKVGIRITLINREYDIEKLSISLLNEFKTVIYTGGFERRNLVKVIGNEIESNTLLLKQKDCCGGVLNLNIIPYYYKDSEIFYKWLTTARY